VDKGKKKLTNYKPRKKLDKFETLPKDVTHFLKAHGSLINKIERKLRTVETYKLQSIGQACSVT
jgi:hypothetical protein